jgi:hypothetical protein
MDQQKVDSRSPEMQKIMVALHESIASKPFSSLEETQAFVAQFMTQRNRSARNEFAGLSPEQMHRILHFPFDSPDLVTVAKLLPQQPTAPV